MTGKRAAGRVRATGAKPPAPKVDAGAPPPVEHQCCIAGCTAVVFKRGLCVEHHDDLSSRAGPFARTAPPRPVAPPPDTPVKTGDADWERLSPGRP